MTMPLSFLHAECNIDQYNGSQSKAKYEMNITALVKLYTETH